MKHFGSEFTNRTIHTPLNIVVTLTQQLFYDLQTSLQTFQFQSWINSDQIFLFFSGATFTGNKQGIYFTTVINLDQIEIQYLCFLLK